MSRPTDSILVMGELVKKEAQFIPINRSMVIELLNYLKELEDKISMVDDTRVKRLEYLSRHRFYGTPDATECAACGLCINDPVHPMDAIWR